MKKDWKISRLIGILNSCCVPRKSIAGKQNMCYDKSRKSLSRANDICAYTKDKMDRFFLFI